MSIKINGQLKDSTTHQVSKDPIGTYTLAANPEIYEPSRTNNFFFICPDLAGITKADGSGTIEGGDDAVMISVISCPMPYYEQEVLKVRRGNNEIRFAGVPTYGAGDIVLNDWIGANTKETLQAWQALSYNPHTEKVGLASDYKKECLLQEYTPDFQLVNTWRLSGCWITKLTETDFSNEDNQIRKITASITYDKARMEPNQ